ncbi:MAG: hypothetical protein COS89_02330 [Deltaproteobacteria bacterium CG07_land_8_20_14_0_80_38_7]|nr:MAG: hypothetical protein COS89_02330 [Deltaproteobacteria bacterium CG07_land_8_20_14_0_80_38_7]
MKKSLTDRNLRLVLLSICLLFIGIIGFNGISGCSGGNNEVATPPPSPDIVCENGICEQGETHDSCPSDCTIVGCGDGTCSEEEDTTLCPTDCPSVCGDGKCDVGETCEADCGSAGTSTVCGDEVCDLTETYALCPADCPATCGDAVCQDTENSSLCPADCPVICGDGFCTHDETVVTCADDCPAVCGDGSCTHDETVVTCAGDCPAVCGDGSCTHEETVDSCPADCPVTCNDGICTGPAETAITCPHDCPIVCGDGLCMGSEHPGRDSCPSDCRIPANVIVVDKTAIGANNGTSWVDAYTELQPALAEARRLVADGAGRIQIQIWIAEGTYYPNVNADTGEVLLPASTYRSMRFQLFNNILIYGGFPIGGSNFTLRDYRLHKTILSGDMENNDIDSDGDGYKETIAGSNSYHVFYNSDVTTNALLDGLVITGGNANGSREALQFGGGIRNNNCAFNLSNLTVAGNSAAHSGGGIFNSGGNPNITNTTITKNSAVLGGGGMYNYSSNPILTNVEIHRNTTSEIASCGGGMHNEHSNPTLINVVISGNSTFTYGGGISNNMSSPVIVNTIFSENEAQSGGGMSNMDDSNPSLTNVLFSNNTANIGGGIQNEESSPILTNVTLTKNTAITNGGPIFNTASSSPVIRNCLIVQNSRGMFNSPAGTNTPSISYSAVQNCFDAGGAWINACGRNGGNNINIPAGTNIFINPDANNFRLTLGSPAINAGNNAFMPEDVTTDMDGSERIFGEIIDLGAYEKYYMLIR